MRSYNVKVKDNNIGLGVGESLRYRKKLEISNSVNILKLRHFLPTKAGMVGIHQKYKIILYIPLLSYRVPTRNFIANIHTRMDLLLLGSYTSNLTIYSNKVELAGG